MDKKGGFDIARKTLYWGICGILLAILVLGLVLLMLSYRGNLIKQNPQLDAKSISSRFAISSDCFALQDAISGRVYQKTIDLERFTNKVMEGCYPSDTTKDYQFQLLLKNLDTNIDSTIATKEWFNTPSFTIKEPVIINDKGKEYNGQLLIRVQRPI